MLQGAGNVSSIRNAELRPNDLKIVAIFTMAVLAVVFFASTKIEMPGNPVVPTAFYGL